MRRFRDRDDAGRRLAQRLVDLGLGPAPPGSAVGQVLVLGLPRGGVVVAAAVAATLRGELDVLVARKLAHPRQPELALGALAEGGEPLWDRQLLRQSGLREADLDAVVEGERRELARRVAAYRGDRDLAVAGRARVVVVDDGLATGATARAALQALRRQGARHLLLALPVAAAERLAVVAQDADDVVVLHAPEELGAVSRWYADFRQVPDEDVRRVLARAWGAVSPPGRRSR